jgi:hypothetical protein
MPKTAMDEYRGSPTWKNDVGRARQVFSMNSEAISEPMQ